ncbi:MAG: CBS domain-containing protein [Bacteroidota bacterium]|nr:CBS domain-containing protein [Bacteroidota bacterium]
MIAKDLIINDFPVLSPNDKGKKAVEIMENFMVSHLAVVDNDSFVGLVSLEDVYDFDMFETPIRNFKHPLILTYIYDFQHIFYVLKSFNLFKISISAVIDEHQNFLGTITQNSLIKSLSNIMSIKEDGFTFVININMVDFSATEICNLVEKNAGKVLSFYIDNDKNIHHINVYLKIQTKDLDSIQQSFERYDYNYQLLNKLDNNYNDMYKERLDNFLNYLNI